MGEWVGLKNHKVVWGLLYIKEKITGWSTSPSLIKKNRLDLFGCEVYKELDSESYLLDISLVA